MWALKWVELVVSVLVPLGGGGVVVVVVVVGGGGAS